MLLNNDLLDDPLAVDACPSFSGGQVSFQRANLLQPNQAATLENVSILINGELKKRRGIRALGAGSTGLSLPVKALFALDTTELDRLIAFVGGSAFAFDGISWSSFFETEIPTTESDIDALQFLDRIYWTDGTKTGLRKFDGGNVSTVDDSPIARILERHGTRLVAAGISGIADQVEFSDLLDGDTWSVVNKIRIGSGDGDPVVGVKSWLDTDLLVCKQGSTYIVGAAPEQDVAYFPVRLVHSAIGCASRKTIVQVGQDLWWLSPIGVVSLQKQLATSNNQIATPVSQPVQDIISRITWSQAHKATAAFHANQYFLSIPVESDWPNTVLVFNTLTGGWTIFTDWNAVCLCSQPFEGNRRLVVGQAGGGLREWLDYQNQSGMSSFTDAGGSFTLPAELPAQFSFDGRGVPAKVVTRALIFGEPLNPKSGFYVEVEFEAEQIALPVDLPFSLPSAPGWGRKRFPIHHLPPFRELQLQAFSDTGNMLLRDITVSAFVDTLELRN